MNNFLTVASQVIILFLLMLVGFICNKAKILNKEANKRISDLVIIAVTPCVIIRSFQREFDMGMLKQLFVALFIAVLVHFVMIVLSKLIIREKDKARKKVLVFGSVFSNAGFIALPLQEALLGSDGVFFGAAYLVIFNIFLWSWGIYYMSGDKSAIAPKKVLLSPGIIGVVIGILIFSFSIKLPQIVSSTITHMSALNVPLPMIVVGYYLAETDFIEALKDIGSYFCIIVRLVLFPVAAIFILYLCGVRGNMLAAMVIATSAPVGATTTMFSEKFGADTILSVRLVSVSTLLSMITMPIVVGFVQSIS